ncbi:MAG: hypothetical protein U0353_13715 [Sandaracinus sp.]
MVQFLSDERQKTVARSKCSPTCACAGWPVRYLGWNGAVQSFDIASSAYAAAFATANGSGLVNASHELRGALDAAREDRMRELEANAAAAEHARVSAEDDRVPILLAEIERAKGPAGRRAVAQRAFAELTRPDTRERLLVGAARIETRLVLEKVDSMKSKAARRRHLEEGIAALRELAIPEGVRVQEISALEAALTEVDA